MTPDLASARRFGTTFLGQRASSARLSLEIGAFGTGSQSALKSCLQSENW